MPESLCVPVTTRFDLGAAPNDPPRAPIRFCVAVDFDGVLARPAWPKIGEEMPGAVDFLRWLGDRGWWIVLWTCRSERLLDDALEWLAERGIARDWWTAINGTPKPICDLYGNDTRKIGSHAMIDDRAIGFPCFPDDDNAPDWPRIQAELETRAAAWHRHN